MQDTEKGDASVVNSLLCAKDTEKGDLTTRTQSSRRGPEISAANPFSDPISKLRVLCVSVANSILRALLFLPQRPSPVVYLLCLLPFFGSCVATPRLGQSKATLWKVQGDHNRVYLLGSIHVLSKQSYPLKPVLERAFDDADKVVFEIDLSRFTKKSFGQEFSRTAFYPPGQSLSKKLTPQTIELLNDLLPLYGLSLRKVEHLKPWFLAEALSSRTLEMVGLSDRLGIDLYFYGKAKAASKPVLGLETLRDQAEIFDRFNDKQNEQYLLSTLSGLPAYARDDSATD